MNQPKRNSTKKGAPQARAAKPVAISAAAEHHEVIVVGAGFGGMGVAIELNRMGYEDIVILDREDDLGGTWHVNHYPGLAVDIASTTYCYSFEPNPYWSRVYAPGPELKKYALHVADKYNLRRFMRFGVEVERAVYDEASRLWTVHTTGRGPMTARFVVLATGFLSQPKYPDIKGLASFKGKVIHTARWDDSYDLTGKRAAVIGTGATAVQLLPEIAPQLAQLDVYQRTPIWCAPKFDGPIPQPVQKLFAALPLTQKLARYGTSSALELLMVAGPLHNKEVPQLSRAAGQMCRAHIARQVRDPELRRKLTPSYDFGCKRPTFSNTYYLTFNRPNVELVTDGIDHIEADGIVTADGRKRKIDTLILATGYKVWEKGNFPAFDVQGRHGLDLREWWNENHYQSYEGITVHGFPNLFYLASPFAFTGLNAFFAIEGQMKHIARCLTEMRRRGASTAEPKKEAQDKFNARMQANFGSTVFAAGNCGGSNSYYFNQHGESTLLRPQPTPVALWQTTHFPLDDYLYA